MTDRLEHLHQQITDSTDPDGDFAVVCPLSGKRPVPVRGEFFPSAAVAEAAVELVCEYRRLLREVDPYLENIPIVAAERDADPLALDDESGKSADSGRSSRNPGRSSRSISLSGEEDGEWLRMDDAPVVHVRRDGELLDDDSIARQLDAQL